MSYHNHTTIKIPAVNGARSVALKCPCGKSAVFENPVDGFFVINTDLWTPGVHHMQQYDASGAVVHCDRIEILQNLKYAPDGYDPRSPEEIALDALLAYINGSATQAHKKVQVDGKSIDYLTPAERMQWLSYYQRKVDRQRGISLAPNETMGFGRW